MVETAVAFCPGHISGYFKRIEGRDPASTGSIGAGVVINEGVRATAAPARAASVRVIRRDRQGIVVEETIGSPPIEYALGRLQIAADITTECRLPIGAGFGLSAAALLSTLTALNRLYDLGLSVQEVAGYAHEAEVLHRTGLGDVAASQAGGVVCRKGPGIRAEIVRFFTGEPLYAVTTGPLSTAAVLSSEQAMRRVAGAYPDRCPGDLEEFFRLSREFAERSGLIAPAVRTILDACDSQRVPASMTMLGNGVFACGGCAEEVLAGFGEVFALTVARHGVRTLEVEP
jgi:pantoate kinase